MKKKTRDQMVKEMWEISKETKFPNFHKDGSGRIKPPNDKNKDKWI